MEKTTNEALADHMNQARLEQRLTWEALADKAGFSSNHLRRIRRGDYWPSELSARDIERALRWEHGSIDAIAAGGDPTPAQPEGPDVEQLLDDAYDLAERWNVPVEQVIADMAQGIREKRNRN